MSNPNDPKELADALKAMKDPQTRRSLTQQDLLLFTCAYFNHYITLGLANFQKEMIKLLEDETVRKLAVMAFRNSGKSTFMTTIYPIWSVMGRHAKKHVLIISKTERQAKLHLQSIKAELEKEDLLKQDLGPFKEDGSWGIEALVIEKYNARIACYSIEQSLRGVRHGQHRPDLIVLDDFEDGDSVQTVEARDKTYAWVNNEILQAGSRDTRVLYAGNFVHEDCYLMRLKDALEKNPRMGKFLTVPLVYPDGTCAWPECFKTPEELQVFKEQMDEETWQAEYLLRAVPKKDQLITLADIKYYDASTGVPKQGTRIFALGVDPAYTLGTKNDYTGMVAAVLSGYEKEVKIQILPGVVIKRLLTDDLIKEIKAKVAGFPPHIQKKVFIEGSHAERGWVDMLKTEGIDAEAIPAIEGKKNRLELYAHLIRRGTILFPKTGAEELIKQLVYFKGAEHEDAADAYSLVVKCLIEKFATKGRMRMAVGSYDHIVLLDPLGLLANPYAVDRKQQLVDGYAKTEQQLRKQGLVVGYGKTKKDEDEENKLGK